MELARIVNLILVSFLGLLPVLLLIGRRARNSRARIADQSEPGTEELAVPAERQESVDVAEEPQVVMRRILPRTRTVDAASASRVATSALSASLPSEQPRHDLRQSARGVVSSLPQKERPTHGTSRVSARMRHLGELQRAVVFAEILGPPVGLSGGVSVLSAAERLGGQE